MKSYTASRRFLHDNGQTLEKFIEKELTPTQKSYIILYGEGLTIREIARRFSVCPSTVSRTIRRGMNKANHTLDLIHKLNGQF
ncbi:MAG: helix-turn-helix domain-containing protein [Ruminococcus sp.]|nr:helix-turn-helix domain-containing protein [Ruminococcus sp.]